MHQLSQNVLAHIRKRDLIRAGHRVGVAVSGGADSVALLRILVELAPELGIVLQVVHLNHQLRGEASDEDAQFVRDLAAEHNLHLHRESHNVVEFSREKKLGLEAAGRQLRYDFFRTLLQTARLDRIATAHTLNDQAETVLLKLVRGAGTRGLAGIYPEVTLRPSAPADSPLHSQGDGSETRAIIRPLLGTTRAEIEAFLKDLGQSWREDATNQELHHTRNRIRHQILPALTTDVNPAVLSVLAETADIARAEELYWNQLTNELLPSYFERNSCGGKLDCEKVVREPLAVQRRIVRAAAEKIGLRLEFRQVEQVIDLLTTGVRATISEGWTAHRRNQNIWVEKLSQEQSYSFPLNVPGEVTLDGARIVASEASSADACSLPLLDRTFALGLVVRNWRDGERFWPCHRKAARKIKELLQDRHVIGAAKKAWPVIASGEHVVWVRGYGVGRDFVSKGVTGVLIREISIEQDPE